MTARATLRDESFTKSNNDRKARSLSRAYVDEKGTGPYAVGGWAPALRVSQSGIPDAKRLGTEQAPTRSLVNGPDAYAKLEATEEALESAQNYQYGGRISNPFRNVKRYAPNPKTVSDAAVERPVTQTAAIARNRTSRFMHGNGAPRFNGYSGSSASVQRDRFNDGYAPVRHTRPVLRITPVPASAGNMIVPEQQQIRNAVILAQPAPTRLPYLRGR